MNKHWKNFKDLSITNKIGVALSLPLLLLVAVALIGFAVWGAFVLWTDTTPSGHTVRLYIGLIVAICAIMVAMARSVVFLEDGV